MKLILDQNLLRLYKKTDKSYIQTGVYKSPETGEVVLPTKWDFDEFVQYTTDEVIGVYLEQCLIKNGQLFKDNEWQECLMPTFLIREKHLARINQKIDEELSKNDSDPIKIFNYFRSKERCNFFTNHDWYKQALENLNARVLSGEKDKTIIRIKLNNIVDKNK